MKCILILINHLKQNDTLNIAWLGVVTIENNAVVRSTFTVGYDRIYTYYVQWDHFVYSILNYLKQNYTDVYFRFLLQDNHY